MAQITIKDPAGKDAGTVELDDSVFGIQPNVPVMHQVVTAQLARRRSGTQSTKTRSEVRGGGAKPYRQKGTGNARQGSTNSPHYTGGGVALGPKPRSYAQRTPKKMIKLALRSALSDRASEGRVVVVDDWGFAAPKTSDARAALAALGLDGRLRDVSVALLSAGQRRRASLAVLLARRPELWLLDEPHAGLDQASRDQLDGLVRSAVAQGATVVLASHEHERAEALADRIVPVVGGQAGTVAPEPPAAQLLEPPVEDRGMWLRVP